jgi:hypothetical protein
MKLLFWIWRKYSNLQYGFLIVVLRRVVDLIIIKKERKKERDKTLPKLYLSIYSPQTFERL